ncbi:MAG: L,D-transpeptidase [Pseudorhodoplanes sp.]
MRSVLRFVSLALALTICSAAQAAILITVDKSRQRMTVAVDGETRWVWPVSTGRNGYATPGGSYTAFRMEKDHFSKEWDDAPMPHSIFFSQRGHAIHGTFDARRLGTAASHGCVRLSTQNAATLFALVKEQGLPNTKVVITGEQPVVAKRRAPKADEDDVADQDAPPARAPSRQAYGQNNSEQGYGYRRYYGRPAYGYQQPGYAYSDGTPAYRSSPYYPPAGQGYYPYGYQGYYYRY